MSEDKILRIDKEGRKYGVSLWYNADGTKVAGMSHFPYVWVDSKSFDENIRDSVPSDLDFALYWAHMQEVIDKVDHSIADLTKCRDALAAHMALSSQLGCIAPMRPEISNDDI